jgi:hypothetical protein
MVGFGNPNSNRELLFKQSVLEIKEKNRTVTILNDCVGFERQDAVVAVWEGHGDSLKLDFILNKRSMEILPRAA